MIKYKLDFAQIIFMCQIVFLILHFNEIKNYIFILIYRKSKNV